MTAVLCDLPLAPSENTQFHRARYGFRRDSKSCPSTLSGTAFAVLFRMMSPKSSAMMCLPAFSVGLALAALLAWLATERPVGVAAQQPPVAAVIRADTFVRVAQSRERSVVFLHTLSGAPTASSGQPASTEPIREGLGSGVVIDAAGSILTNAHVVDGASAVHVRTVDGEDIDAQVVGIDPDNDIALLRAADVRGLRAAPLGDSDKVRVGDLVVAIGNPLGLHHTVTTGIISAKARGLDDTGTEFLQTDAAVNPGSSGGPLLNLNGEVVGLTTAILSKYGENVGLNFAIPINVVKTVLPQLRRGSVAHGWLGVTTRSLTPTAARLLGITGGGLLVTDLHLEGPAVRAGVEIGDVLVGLGTPPAVGAARDIHRRVREAMPGNTVVLRVWRNRQYLSVPVVLSARPTKQ